jgi:P27 family predicted phage terminase small subunit
VTASSRPRAARQAVVRHRQAAVIVARTGTLVKGAEGNAVKNPACQMARDYANLMTRVASRFGLTPGDRAQIKYDHGPAALDPDDILSIFA